MGCLHPASRQGPAQVGHRSGTKYAKEKGLRIASRALARSGMELEGIELTAFCLPFPKTAQSAMKLFFYLFMRYKDTPLGGFCRAALQCKGEPRSGGGERPAEPTVDGVFVLGKGKDRHSPAAGQKCPCFRKSPFSAWTSAAASLWGCRSQCWPWGSSAPSPATPRRRLSASWAWSRSSTTSATPSWRSAAAKKCHALRPPGGLRREPGLHGHGPDPRRLCRRARLR